MSAPPAYTATVAQAAYQALQMNIHNMAEAERIIYEAIDHVSDDLWDISQDLHTHPETGLNEFHAHKVLTDYLERKGFNVTRHAFDLQTAFMAEFSTGQGRRVGFCAEYDGLKGLGQGCGHNLIAITGVACAIAVKALLEKGLVTGRVVLFGTPAEEPLIGKIEMVNRRAFQDNVDVCMMLHPGAEDLSYSPFTAQQSAVVEYRGKASHAGAAPWEGVNALDAICEAYNNIAMLRQQLLPTDRIHGIITDGGKAPNVIPDFTSGYFYVRAADTAGVERLMDRAEKCFQAAAISTGCQVSCQWRVLGVIQEVNQNSVLAEMYGHYMSKLGVALEPRVKQLKMSASGSTDFGNVSHVMPGLHPMFSIHTTAPNHTVEFTAAAATRQAHADAVRASKALSVLAARTLMDAAFYNNVRREFHASISRFK